MDPLRIKARSASASRLRKNTGTDGSVHTVDSHLIPHSRWGQIRLSPCFSRLGACLHDLLFATLQSFELHEESRSLSPGWGEGSSRCLKPRPRAPPGTLNHVGQG